LKTDDIKCELSKNGYNSSIILWRNGVGDNIYDTLEKYHNYIVTQLVRFDHYLELMIKGSDFIQDLFNGKVLDYNECCKGIDILPQDASIIAFPRSPKPHECTEKWVVDNWV